MVEAITISAAQAQILAARLFAQATAQGQAILAAAATSDASNNQPQTGGDPGQRGAGLPTPQTPQPPANANGQAAAEPSPAAAGPASASAPAPSAPANPASAGQQAPQQALQEPGAPPILARAALVEDLARPTAAPTTPPSIPVPATPPPSPQAIRAAPPSPAVSFARIEAFARQDTAAPLLADLEVVVAQNLAPPQVRTAARAVLAAALPLEPDVTTDDLRQAIRNSGVFLEARLAQTLNPQVAADGKGALLTLLRALRIWSVPSAPEEAPGNAEEALAVEDGPDASPPANSSAGKAAPPAPPPIKGQAPRPEAPASSNLTADMAPGAVRAQLIKRTDAAVARTTLLQMASSEAGGGGATNAPSSTSWLFELPVTTSHGPTTLPFEIDRDGEPEGGASDAGPAQQAWRVRFAFDIEPVGPVWVQAQLRGRSAAVTVLAERPGVAEALSRRAGDLAESLAADGLEAHVSVSNGAPAAPAAAPGRFLDRAT
jgi:hypothetical protein